MLKLNLGCGRYPFPLDREHIPNPEHLNDLPDEVFEPDWCNADKSVFPGVQKQINLFRFPWPFDDNTFDLVWIGHLVEHIPHEVRTAHPMPNGKAEFYANLCDEWDGFFVFMYEVWRVMKPGAVVHVRAPFGVSYPSLSDPTHTRYLTPGTFSYLYAPQEKTPFDYHVPCRFELENPNQPYMPRFRGEYARDLELYTPQGLMDLMLKYNNVVDEFRMALRAVKE